MSHATWYVYLARCADGSFYTGVAKDVARRLAQHDAGKGAKYTRGRGPLELCAQAACEEKGQALKMERRIKALPRTEKLRLAALGHLASVALAMLTAAVLAVTAGCDPPGASPLADAGVSSSGTTSWAALAPDDAALAAVARDAAPSGPVRSKSDCIARDGTVDFHGDALLEADVRKKLQRATGPVTEADLKTIKSINLSGGTVNALDACIFPRLTAVRDVFVGPGEVSDLSPLANLTELRGLRLSVSQVSDLAPLEKLAFLDRLDLGRTGVHDLTSVAHLTNLTELQLDDTLVSDIGPLASCPKLQKVSLQRTAVQDLSPLRGATQLRFLYLEGAPVHDLSPLAGLVARGLRIVQTKN